MPSKKQCHYPHIGFVTYTYKSKIKRITLRVKPDNSIHVSVPFLVSFKRVEEFVLSKKEWIISRLTENQDRAGSFAQNGFQTKYHRVELVADNSVKGILPVKKSNLIEIHYPASMDPSNSNLQDFTKSIVINLLRKEAKAYLPTRLAHLAAQHGFSYTQLSIRNSRTRWGSCSGRNSINLSLHLMVLPDQLIDYVILHELCHTRVKNHGPEFWELLNTCCNGKAKELAKELKQHRITV